MSDPPMSRNCQTGAVSGSSNRWLRSRLLSRRRSRSAGNSCSAVAGASGLQSPSGLVQSMSRTCRLSSSSWSSSRRSCHLTCASAAGDGQCVHPPCLAANRTRRPCRGVEHPKIASRVPSFRPVRRRASRGRMRTRTRGARLNLRRGRRQHTCSGTIETIRCRDDVGGTVVGFGWVMKTKAGPSR